jgi:hypothetical protein
MDAAELLAALEEVRELVPFNADDRRARSIRYHLDRATAAARLAVIELQEENAVRRAREADAYRAVDVLVWQRMDDGYARQQCPMRS